MKKRFVDIDIWDKAWFRKLKSAEKEAFRYIIDKCDNVGVLDVDFEGAEYLIGEKVDWENLVTKCNNNIEILPNGKWFVPGFCDFQYGELKDVESNKPHRSYIHLLRKHGLYERVMGLSINTPEKTNKGYTYPMDTFQDQEQATDTEKEKENREKSVNPTETTTNTTKDTLVPKETITKQIVTSQIADKAMLNVELEKIPDCLKGFTNWVYWKNTKLEDGKFTKIPYSDVGKPAKTNDSTTWKRFQDVKDWKTKGFSGIGFVLNKDDPFTFIDLDKCIENGKLSSFAQNVGDYFDSYTEISPSGTGLHIILVGKIEKAVKQVEIEIYDSGRYMAMTGHVYLDRIVKKQQSKLDKVIKKYCKRKVKLKNNYIFPSNGKFTMPKEKFNEGMRNNELAKWGGILNTKDLGETDYFGYLHQINKQCCTPPLLESEVEAIGKSIRRYK